MVQRKGVIVVLTLLVLIIPLPSFATHESQNIVWHLVVVSNQSGCGVDHYRLGEKYQIITKEYFEMYDFETSNYHPECYTKENFAWKYDRPSDLDLLIIVYDRDMGREELHPLGIGGFYSHSGGDITHNHTIVFCECSNFHYSDPSWILSHELSHFILNYLGFDLEIVEKEIHQLDFKYDFCMEESYDPSCKEVINYLENPSLGHRVKVMKPYESAVGKNAFPQYSNGTNLLPTETLVLKEVTEWWVDGKISDKQYSKIMTILTGQNVENVSSGLFFAESATLLLGEPQKEGKISGEENKDVKSKHDQIIESFPFIEDWNPSAVYAGEFPQWFKTRALLWTGEKISNDEFLASIESLLSSVKETDRVGISINDLIETGNEEIKQGELRKGLMNFELALAKSLENGELSSKALLGKGISLYLLGNYPEALVYFDAVLEIEPNNSEAMKNKGHALAQMGKLEQARLFFEMSILNQEYGN